ncbi:MAG: PDZ domain-containing protein [Dehalococcoidia bacterium]
MVTKGRAALAAAGVAIALAVLLAYSLVGWRSGDDTPPGQVPQTATAVDLGITYLPVTQSVSEYYGLEVDSGALVTEVTPGSPSYRAGIEVGDVILNFNGAQLGEGVSLLGMMMACQAGHMIVLEVQSGKCTRVVEVIHGEI